MRGPALTTTVSFPNTQEYIDAHGISKTVEEVINATVKAKAPEPCSFMARTRSQPRLSGVPLSPRGAFPVGRPVCLPFWLGSL